MFAIVQIQGHQYKVTPGQAITVDRLLGNVGDTETFTSVLLTADEGNAVVVGTPFVPNVEITAKIVAHTRGDKIRVARFRAKSRHRRVVGFRAGQTELLIESIGKHTAKVEVKSAPKSETTEKVAAPKAKRQTRKEA